MCPSVSSLHGHDDPGADGDRAVSPHPAGRARRRDPQAFGSTHERESAFDDETWTARLTGFDGHAGVVIVHEGQAEDDGVVGIGWAPEPGVTWLWGMWVEPTARRSGVAVELLEAAVAWAREAGSQVVQLWIMEGNDAAGRLYERAGFRAADPLGEDDCSEYRMIFDLG